MALSEEDIFQTFRELGLETEEKRKSVLAILTGATTSNTASESPREVMMPIISGDSVRSVQDVVDG